MTSGGRFFDHLGDMFLSDMGMNEEETDHDGLDEDEFCRIATEERLVSESELAAAPGQPQLVRLTLGIVQVDFSDLYPEIHEHYR